MAHAPTPSNTSVRPAVQRDLHFLPAIFNHYITHTVVSFRLKHVDVAFYEGVWEDTRKSGLPFFVSFTRSASEGTGGGTREDLIGYTYALPFRGSYPAYRHTVEISIFIHPEYHSLGVGSALMDTLMDALRMTQVPDPTLSLDSNGVAEEGEPGRIHQVLVVMSLDPNGRDNGHGLENFYGRWGFERVGHLKRVGYKFAMWIDVLILQVTI